MKVKILMALVILSLLASAGPALAEDNTPPSPIPLMSPVPPDKLLKPGEGLGDIKFGSTIGQVEEICGKGTIVPLEPDFQGNSTINLQYKDKGLNFSFANGFLSIIEVDTPGYATVRGVQVGVEIGEMIREFGTVYKMQNQYTATTSADVRVYDIYYDMISASVKDKVITKIRIRMGKKPRGR